MCGLTGFIQPHGFRAAVAHATAEAMARQILHRGPDDWGVWTDADVGLALAHRRLSILDLSPAGHQPMVSGSGRFVIAFNGEIYNHLALREALGEVPWRGHSDTETLLAGFDAWGVESTLRRTVGMFAIVLWDREDRSLYLACDRMGEKPLYYGWQNGVFLFGSELKALKAHPAFQGEIDRDALTLLLRHMYIPAPYSIYKGIRKLPPGTMTCFSTDGEQPMVGELPPPEPYWSLRSAVDDALAEPFTGGDHDAVNALEAHLQESIAFQMIADVPIGAFLSGGIDSSTVVALMQAQSRRPVKTFTIGFQETGYNEAEHARAVARHLGADHTELYVTSDSARAVIPRLPALYDEPFSDPSQIPTFLVAQMARQHVTVALSGDGGDELLGGYNRYFLTSSLWRYIRLLPLGVRHALVLAIQSLPPKTWNRVSSSLGKVLPKHMLPNHVGEKAYKIAEMLKAGNPQAIYYGLISHATSPAEVVIGASEPSTALTDSLVYKTFQNIEQCMMFLDAITYLPDDILVKVDRAAMGASLETRMPFLDHRVVEFCWRLPLSMKIRGGQGKWILRQILHKYVPKELIERPKMGFSVPIDTWLRGPLRDWAGTLLEEGRLRREGFFHPEPIRQKWSEHLAGKRNWQYYLWNVLMFQAWLEKERGH